MKTPRPHSALRATLIVLISALVPLGATSVLARQSTGTVTFSPNTVIAEGNMPFASTYTITVNGPANVSPGSSIPIGLSVTPTTVPLGTVAQAISYVSFSPSTLTFTAPNQSQSVNVIVAFPVLSFPSSITSATFSYQINTSGWPAALGITDTGLSINATASLAPPPAGSPPIVVIQSPVDGSSLTYPSTAMPANVPFQFQVLTNIADPITSLAATFGGNPVAITTTTDPLTGTLTGTGTLPVSTPGAYSVSVVAVNTAGQSTATSNFSVIVTGLPPTVQFTSPAPNAVFSYHTGDPATAVSVNFTANSTGATGIRTLTATVDAVPATFMPMGIGSATATGTLNLSYTTAGTHTVVVTTTDDNGSATATTSYTIQVIAPNPTVTITTPANNAVIDAPINATAADVPFSFSSTASNGFNVDAVSATLDGNPVTIASTTGIGTPSAISTGTLFGVGGGSHTLVATATSAGVSVTATTTFTVKLHSSEQPPPSVVIDTPDDGAAFIRFARGPALDIPLKFTATSNAVGGVITQVGAILDGSPLAVSATLGQPVVTATATMTVSGAGVHTIVVTAKDDYGNASDTHSFTVTVLPGSTVSGTIFFDVDGDGAFDPYEFGLSGIPVALRDSTGHVVNTASTALDGTYAFPQVPDGTYTVAAGPVHGLVATHGATRNVTVNTSDVGGVNIGFALDFNALQGMTANGYSLGFWKNNLQKALGGKNCGTQIPAAKLLAYTNEIGSLALSPYDGISERDAVAIMSSTSSKSTDLLSKQLIAAEYNYENGAYIGGDGTLTFLFVWWGEHVLSNPSNYSSTYILWAKDWFDAYDNSHGGGVAGPDPLSGSSSGSAGGSNDGGTGGHDLRIGSNDGGDHGGSGSCSGGDGKGTHDQHAGGNDDGGGDDDHHGDSDHGGNGNDSGGHGGQHDDGD